MTREVAKNQPRQIEGVTREVPLGYIYDDVQYPGKLTLVDMDAMTDKTPFLQIVDEIVAMHNKKQQDYGRTGDPFANVRASSDFGVPAWVGCMIRANDKMKRIQKAASGDTLVNESLEDSLLDLAVYSIIGLVLLREDNA
jgi:hypothetical protein